MIFNNDLNTDEVDNLLKTVFDNLHILSNDNDFFLILNMIAMKN